MILTVTLNAAVARTLVVPNLAVGHRHRSPDGISLAGGKGINVARALRSLGAPVMATGLVGGRNGDAIRDGLAQAAIPFDLVETKSPSRTSTAIIDPTNGTQTEINEKGASASPEEAREFLRRLEFLMEYATAVVFAGSMPDDFDENFLAVPLNKAREAGLYTVVDAPSTVLKAALKAKPSLVSPNQNEAEGVAGFDFIQQEDFVWGLSRLVELGAGRACVTSPQGYSYLTTPEGVISAQAPNVEALSTIGSGDSYLAGLLAGFLHRDLPAAEAVRLAAGCAAANAETLGAGVFEARRAEELAREVQVETAVPAGSSARL